MSSLRLLASVLALLLVISPTKAQEAQRTLYSTDNFVRSAAIAADTLYVGGDFITVGPPTGPAAVLDKVTGEADLTQARIGGDVEVVLPDGSGGWYVGGEFEWAGGEPRRNLAHILPDGSLDEGFAPDPQLITINPFFFGYVDGLALSEDSTVLYVGGRFNTVSGEPRENLAALDARTGALLPLSVDFERPGSDFIDITALLHKDGVLYAGGRFSSVNGVERVGAAAFDTESGMLLPWDPELTADDDFIFVFGFGVGPPPTDTTLYVGGLFDAVQGEPRPTGSAEVTLADSASGGGGEPTAWTTGFGLGGGPYTVTDDVIWAPALGGTPLFTISRETGAATGFLDDSPYRSSTAIALDSTGGPSGEGVVYLSAQRSFPGDPFPSRYLVAVDAETKRILPDYFDADLFEGGALRVASGRGSVGVTSLVVEPGPEGRLFAGGFDDLYGIGPSEARRFLAGIDLTTGRVIPFGEDYVIFSSVEEVAISPDERYLYFLTFNGLGVADLQTGILTDFPGNARAAGTEEVGTTEADSPAGPIRRAGPVLARADGRPLAPFTPLARPEPAPETAGDSSRFRTSSGSLLATDDRLYLHEGGVAAYDRFNGDLLWFTDTDGFFSNPQDEEVLLVEAGPPGAAGDTLFLAGPLDEVGGEPRQKFAALDAETGAVLGWNVNPVEEPNGVGQSLAALGSRIYLGGSGLFVIGGEPREDLAAADRTTGEVLGWTADPEATAGGALAAQPGPSGGADGGVLYAGPQALDAETGALFDWDLEPQGGGVFNVLVSERHERVILTGLFTNSLRGSGHAFVTALTPARPFGPVAAEDEAATPARAALSAAHPNPFRGTAALTLSLPSAQGVEVSLFDVLGRRVAVLHAGPLSAGEHALTVDGSGLPSGVYVVRAQGEAFSASRRVTVVR